ncbi:hypothetical protein [Mycolicibacterium sp. XJ870]
MAVLAHRQHHQRRQSGDGHQADERGDKPAWCSAMWRIVHRIWVFGFRPFQGEHRFTALIVVIGIHWGPPFRMLRHL